MLVTNMIDWREIKIVVHRNNAKKKSGLYTCNYARFYLKYELSKAALKEYSDAYEQEKPPFQECKKAFLANSGATAVKLNRRHVI